MFLFFFVPQHNFYALFIQQCIWFHSFARTYTGGFTMSSWNAVAQWCLQVSTCSGNYQHYLEYDFKRQNCLLGAGRELCTVFRRGEEHYFEIACIDESFKILHHWGYSPGPGNWMTCIQYVYRLSYWLPCSLWTFLKHAHYSSTKDRFKCKNEQVCNLTFQSFQLLFHWGAVTR